MMDDQLIGVYRIVSPNGSCYVGATAVSFRARWGDHRSDFRYGKTKCSGLRRAFEKYGEESMQWEILEVVPRDLEHTIWVKEREWWLKLKASGVNIYNGCPSGTGSVHHTDETRRKIGESVKLANPLKTYNHQCGACGEAFVSIRPIAKFCNKKCQASVQRQSVKQFYGLTRDDLLALYQEHTVAEISDLIGCSLRKAYYLFKDFNIPLKSKKGP